MPATTRRYVYGIIRSDAPLLFDVSGIDGGEVYTVGAGDMAVVASDVAYEGLHGLARSEALRHLNDHQRVLEAVQQEYTVLPIKFGTILPDEARVRTLLYRGDALISAALAAYAGKRQFEVVVLWDMAQVFQQIAADERIAAIKAQIAGRAPEETVAERLLIGKLVHAELQRRRAEVCAHVTGHLRGLAEDVIVNPLMDDSMVANVALLLDDAGRDALDERLDALDAQYGGRLQIRCVGPLPPHSFATLEVHLPPFEAVDAARQRLGLAEEVSYSAVKRAYRQLAAQAHPDHNQGDAEASAAMDALTGAYRLLTAVSLAQVPASSAAAGDWICHFDRAAVEETMLLAIARQETAPQHE